MPNWKTLVDEVNTLKAAGTPYDRVRRKYLRKLAELTGRNTIVYYSGWQQKPQIAEFAFSQFFTINDSDKNSFMAVIHELDRSKGLDLLLHTPGGEVDATESLVDYLHSMFNTDIRAIVPQLAMSAGTMIACACREIVMGKHSSLGPIDPQIDGIAAHGIIEEFNRAREDILKNRDAVPLWQPIIAHYDPTLIGECEKAIALSNEVVTAWLINGMFRGDPDAEEKANKVVTELGSHAVTKSHARHISLKRAKKIGLVVQALEDDNDLQDAVLSVHHACIHSLAETAAAKIVENQKGAAHILAVSPPPSP